MSSARFHPEEQDGATEQETVRYIADMAGGMSALARHSGLDVLAYLLELVRLEAEEAAQNAKARDHNLGD